MPERIRIKQVGNRLAVWVGWAVFTMTMRQAEDLFDKLGAVIVAADGISDDDIAALLEREGP